MEHVSWSCCTTASRHTILPSIPGPLLTLTHFRRIHLYFCDIPHLITRVVPWLGLRKDWEFFAYLLAGLGWVSLGLRVVLPVLWRA
jgi:hypothetical protein